jgi:tetratricopeptide (TPR) repeat protein
MNDSTTYDLIEQYLAGTMTADGRRDFERRLDTDPALRAEVLLHREVTETLRGEKVHELRRVIKDVDQSFTIPKSTNLRAGPNNSRSRILSFPRVLSIAAAVLVLVVAVFVLMPDRSVGTDTLFAQHYEPYEMILNQRSVDETETLEQLIRTAVMAYETKDFEQAAILFENLSQEQPDAETFQLYLGVSLLSSGAAEAAIITLEKLNEKASPLFVEQSRWYLAMAYLKSSNVAQAKSTLQRIETGAFQYVAAQEILKELE